MPLDIASDCVLDPMLADTFNVIRRMETVGANGRSTTQNQTFKRIVGVVNMSSDAEVVRQQFPEMEFSTRVISVVCKFRLQTAVQNYQPDIVVWRGNNYLVQQIALYPQYGAGFYEATCTSMDTADAAI